MPAAVALELRPADPELVAEWNALAVRLDARPWLRPGWFEAWTSAFGEEIELVCGRREGELVALVPFVRGQLGRRVSPTNWHTPAFDALAEDDEAALAVVDASRRGAASLSLRFLDPEGSAFPALTELARHHGLRTLSRVILRSPYVEVAGEWPEYERALSGNLRHDLGRRTRRLHEAGEVEVQTADGSDRLHELLEEGFAVEAAGWKGREGTAIASRPDTRAFYTQLARWAAAEGWLRLVFLRLDGHPLAFQYCFEHDGALLWFKGGFDEEYSRFAPAKLLLHLTVERCFESGIRTFEFLGDEQPYKQSWATGSRERLSLQVFSPSPAGRAEWVLQAHARPAAVALRAAGARLRQRLAERRAT